MEHGPNKILFVGVPAAAKMLSISPSTLYREIEAGRFPYKKIAGKILISLQVLEEMAKPPSDKQSNE